VPKPVNEWSDAELHKAVKTYLWMLRQESDCIPYSKADVNRSLREGPLRSRSKSSVEYRMQNISATLEELCLPRIQGYVPAKNLGAGVRNRIRRFLIEESVYIPEEYAPTAESDELDEKARRLSRKIVSGIPKGIEFPKQAKSNTVRFYRDPLVKAWLLNNSNGVCEGCRYPAPFLTMSGDPYLEVHHIKSLSEGGSDTIFNTVTLCPNCHRRCHNSCDRANFSILLSQSMSRPKL
jgi:5-methylcytosine-specific restriction protein A